MRNNYDYLKYNLSICALCILATSCNGGRSGTNNSVVVPSSATYQAFNCLGSNSVSFPGVSGIRQVSGSTDVYITGVYVEYGASHGFLYQGPVLGGGVCNQFTYPSSSGVTVTSTSLYGPDSVSNGNVVVTGSYTTEQSGVIAQLGFVYQGAADGSTTTGYTTLNPQSLTSDTILNTLGHSTMGGIVVGNYDTNIITGQTFIYNIATNTYYSLHTPNGSASITAYGVWYNGGTSYTIAGGYSAISSGGTNIGFITDWDSSTQQTSNFTTLNYNNLPATQAGTHFEGITTDGSGGYNLATDWQYPGQANTSPAFAHITRNSDGSFATATWVAFPYYPGSSWTSANTVYENYILGLFQAGNPVTDYGYVATIQTN